MERPVLLQVEGISVVKHRHPVLDQIRFDLRQGMGVAVCGASGSGKTTLLRAVAGLETLASGRVVFDGYVRNAPGLRRCGHGDIGMVFQGEQLYRHLTLLDNIMLAPKKVLGLSDKQARQRAFALLERVGLAPLAHRYPGQLSGGERQRGAIARALAMTPKLMLFDEPTSALDATSSLDVLKLILSIREQGQAMIVVTHNAAFARSFADEVFIMDDGRLACREDPENVCAAPADRMVRRLFDDALTDISAIDRLKLSGKVTAGVFTEEDLQAAAGHAVLAALRQNGIGIEFRLLRQGEAGLQLRLHLADCLVYSGDMSHEQGLARIAGGEQDRLNLYAASGDKLWIRYLRNAAGR